MGLETLIYVGLAGIGGAAAAGAFSGKPSKPRFPTVPTRVKGPATKIKGETERAKAYLASRRRRGGSREKSQVTMPGYLDPAQVQRPTLADVLG